MVHNIVARGRVWKLRRKLVNLSAIRSRDLVNEVGVARTKVSDLETKLRRQDEANKKKLEANKKKLEANKKKLEGIRTREKTATRELAKAKKQTQRLTDKIERQRHEIAERYRRGALTLSSSPDRIWLFTQMKSGTTYVINFLVNYCLLLLGEKTAISSETLSAFHTMERKVGTQTLASALEIQRRILAQSLGTDALIHTHIAIDAPSFGRIVCLTRHPFDFVVSSHQFHFVQRGRDVDLSGVLLDRLALFARHHHEQERILANHPGKAIRLHYEEIVQDPRHAFRRLLAFLGVEPEEELLTRAIAASSKESVRRMEEESGAPIIAGAAFQGSSFIRSGKQGEWHDVFGSEDVAKGREFLQSEGIDLDSFEVSRPLK